jgi:sulfur carrier protein ThiS
MKIRFLGPIQRPSDEIVAAVSAGFAGGTVRTLLQDLGFPAQQVNFLSVIREAQRLTPDQELRKDDEITVMLLVGGG